MKRSITVLGIFRRTGLPRLRVGTLCLAIGLASHVASASIFDSHSDIRAQYDFTYATNAEPSDPAGPPSNVSDTPFYIFDGTNSGLSSDNPNIRFGPEAQDLSGNDNDLFHERIFTGRFLPSSSTHTRYVTSAASNGGSGAEGIYLFAGGGPIPMSAHQFTVGEFSHGFTIDLDIEVDRTTSPTTDDTLVRLPGIILAMNGGSGEATATIEGTFGNAVTGTTPLYRTNAIRPQFNIKLVYLPWLGTSTDNLFLFVNDVLEDSKIANGITLANGVPLPLTDSSPLTVLGNGDGSRTLTGVIVKGLTVSVPEPTTGVLSMAAWAALLCCKRHAR